MLSRIAWIVVASLLGAASVFCPDTPKDSSQQQNASSESTQADSSASKAKPIGIGDNVAAANLTHQVTPEYPPLAKTAHVSGTVLLHAIIATDGTVDDLQYVSGPPLLMKSAIDAVKQWRYKPTLLNGEPVRVDTTISVVFTLGRDNPNGAAPNVPPVAPGSSTQSTAPSSQDVPKNASVQEKATTNGTQADVSASRSIHLAANVAAAQLVHTVVPVYPNDVKKRHIQGTVLLHAIIAKDGTIRALEYVSGPSELMNSAMDAVKQWRYKPTTVDGMPVEVDTKISVLFRLGNN